MAKAKTAARKRPAARARKRGPRFVVHEHHASSLHFDLRLEVGGVLKSWSVPRGPTMVPGERRLAVEVPDHSLEYGGFEGEIVEGKYGAGRVHIWDEGAFASADGDAAEGLEKGRLAFELAGARLRGEFLLVRMNRPSASGQKQWLLIKRDDDEAVDDWTLELVEPDPRFDAKAARRRPKASRARKVTHDEPAEVVTAKKFLALDEPSGTLGVRAGKSVVKLTSLERPYWPREGYTKADLLKYYAAVGPVIMPHLKGRPAILKRHPEGVEGEAFFQHDVVSAPDYVETRELESETGRRLNYAVYTDLASLLYLANIGTIAQNPWHSRVDRLDRPDYVVLDLDPKGAPFKSVLEIALVVREELEADGLEGYPKTSGSSGVHVFVPVARVHTYAETAAYAERLAARVARRLPKIATVERALAERKKTQVYVDWLQNARAKAAASVYTVRARPGATVSTPVTWEEVERGFTISDFTIRNVPARVEELGDLWAPMMRSRQRLPKA